MRVLMTGGTSGIGLHAARRLLSSRDAELTVAARQTGARPGSRNARPRMLPVRLESLASVRDLARALQAEPAFDVVALNAGVQCTTAQTSEDGFELTFAVNHLAHYLLARLLAPTLAPGGRIIFTASGTHDPEEKTGMPAPRHADAIRLAFPARDPQRDANPMKAGRRAYSTSKLCNIMTARELANRLAPTRPDLAVIAYDPGFTPGTGLARNYPGLTGVIFKYVMPLTTRRSPSVSTPENSGRLLSELATGQEHQAARGQYYVMRGEDLNARDPSVLARDPAACARLWDDSAALVGVPANL